MNFISLRSVTVLRGPDFCILKARPLSVHGNTGGSGRGMRNFLDHTSAAFHCMLSLACALQKKVEACNVRCTVAVWFEILVPYHLDELRGMTYSFWTCFLVGVMEQYMRCVMKIKKDTWLIVDAQYPISSIPTDLFWSSDLYKFDHISLSYPHLQRLSGWLRLWNNFKFMFY